MSLALVALLWTQACPCLANPLGADSFDDSQVSRIVYPEWFKDTFYDLQDDLRQALTEGKKGLLVFFTTEGCSYCRAFIERSLANPEIEAMVRRNFDAVGLEIFGDEEITDPQGGHGRVKEFAQREGAEFAPTLLFYGEGGKRLFRAVGYYPPERFRMVLDFVAGGHYRDESFASFAANGRKPEDAAPGTLIEDELFGRPPYALDRRATPADRPLLVLFERAACERCERFHSEVLADPQIRSLLAKFEVVRLDAADEKTPVLGPDGRRLTPAGWFEGLGFSAVPALVFFDQSGREVLETDALVLRQRMVNSLNFVLEKAYAQGMSYQRFARQKSIERAAGD